MFTFIIQKILNKKWLISCMLIGTLLLIAVACCNPMYTAAALQKMLTDELESQMEETNEYPAVATVSGTLSNSRLAAYSSELFTDPYTAADKLSSLYEKETLNTITSFETADLTASLIEKRDGFSSAKVTVDNMLGFSDHIEIMYGSMFTDNVETMTVTDSETGDESEAAVYEAVISESMLISTKLVVGDILSVKLNNNDGQQIYIKITGVFTSKDDEDSYWVRDALDYDADFFISDNVFKDVFMQENMITSVTAFYYAVFDYTAIKTDEINSFISTDNIIRKDCKDNGLYTGKFNYEEPFTTYRDGSTKVTVTMWIFQIPVLILLCVFIFMVSNQIISIEQSEIAMLKSRGVSKKQLILSYFGQGGLISAVGLLIGLPLGYLFCVAFGATRSFMEFSIRTTIEVHFTLISFLYALIAAAVAAIIMTLPVFKYANFSIVEQKTNKKKKKKPLWQTVFLDFILLVISLYGLYSFYNQQDVIIKKINNGGTLDPLLYFSSTVFILATALILLRILPLVVKLVYKIGRKKWKPASFAAFMQITKNIRSQSFIIVFLVLTLALGIFNATTARSINDNEEIRLTYDNGATVVMQENWVDNSAAIKLGLEGNDTIEYKEPDYNAYTELASKVNSLTRVVVDDHATVSNGNQTINNSTTFMAITTDEFGQTAYMPDNVTKFHWYYYLNALAEDPYGAIISRNYAELTGIGVGDEFTVYRNDGIGQNMPMLTLTVSAIVDAWPGYESKILSTASDGSESYLDHYLVVCNFYTAKKTYGVEPYQIWINADDTQPVYDFAEETGKTYTTFVDSTVQTEEIKEQPFFQVTSGMLTITFVVVLVMSMIGFLIYWITSIKSRELMFGIYRAMGMSMKEIITMLVFEHLFGSVIPIIYGVFVGLIGAKLFVPLIQLAYSPTYSTIEAMVITSASDMVRIGLCVLLMLIICFVLLGRILSGMKIAQALKLGED
jgi:putative ABC transport system permease protein